MRDVPTRCGLPDCGHYGETLRYRLCGVLVSMQTVDIRRLHIPLLVLFVRSLGLDRLSCWEASDSRHGDLIGVVEYLVAVIENEVSSVTR